jgi:hypothetical protein
MLVRNWVEFIFFAIVSACIVSTSCHQIFVIRIGRNAIMQDQSQGRHGEI